MKRRFFSLNSNFNADKYLTIEALEDGLRFVCGGSVFYKTDRGSWIFLQSNTISNQINKGECLYIKSNWTKSPNVSVNGGLSAMYISADCNLKGNCFSLVFGDNADKIDEMTDIPEGIFSNLFYRNEAIKEVSADFLPLKKLSTYCYQLMFGGCTSLTQAPTLPATTLASYCYHGMFEGCTSLTQAPTLPATTLVDHCYSSMFGGCTSLTQAPTLPATTLASYCYSGMFYNCTSLTQAPTLPATTLANWCYSDMFQDCTSLTQAPTLPATTLASSCYSGMFQGCTSLTQAPTLPATTLASNCYSWMFYNCAKLNYIKAMFTTTPSTSYTNNWVKGVASTGRFIKNSKATWNVTGANAIPSGWTVMNHSQSMHEGGADD